MWTIKFYLNIQQHHSNSEFLIFIFAYLDLIRLNQNKLAVDLEMEEIEVSWVFFR